MISSMRRVAGSACAVITGHARCPAAHPYQIEFPGVYEAVDIVPSQCKLALYVLDPQ
jgi:hypothetical protein